MYGPVSISASLPKIAKDMIVFYYSHDYSSDKNLLESKIPYRFFKYLCRQKILLPFHIRGHRKFKASP
mgnify:CR=1 FL=1